MTWPAVVTPGGLGLRDDLPLPIGTVVDLEDDTQEIADGVLFGGSPARVLRLSAAGVAALAELRAGPVTSVAGAVLARRLTDSGLAQPRVARPSFRREAPVAAVPGVDEPVVPEPGGAAAPPLAVTVVVPVRDRAAELDRCLAAAGRRHPVVVVDDGSADPAALAAVCAARGAELVRREVNGGPAAARNTGLRVVGTEFVAFLDSDCVPAAEWIADLAGHFADPLVAAVAPRIVAAPAASPADSGNPAADPAPAEGRGSVLDLGDRAARVAPMTRVAYVPTAALVVRRAALGDGFDEALRYGEDVDLVWRLVAAGWRVRYDPGVRIGHAEPASRPELLHRRFEYGRSAAPLTRRHPGAVAPLVLQPWPTITMAALLAAPACDGGGRVRALDRAAGRPAARQRPAGHRPGRADGQRGPADVAGHRPVVRAVRGARRCCSPWPGRAAGRRARAGAAAGGGVAAGRAAADRLGRPARRQRPPGRSGSPPAPWPTRPPTARASTPAACASGMISPVLPAVSVKPFEGLRRRRPAAEDRAAR